MQIEGLNRNYYYVNNPIWVRVFDYVPSITTIRVTVSIANVATQISGNVVTLELADFNGEVFFDASTIAKGFMPFPEFEPNAAEGAETNNIIQLSFYIETVDLNGNTQGNKVRVKNFIRGGIRDGYNATATDGMVLKESREIPRWPGFPIRFYKISGNKIVSSLFFDPDFTEQMRTIGCDGAYIAFLNSKGGYSYWLFEKYRLTLETKEAEKVTRMRGFDSLGEDNTYSISVESRVPRKYYGIMRALSQSPEVYIYDLSSKFDLGFDNTFEQEDIQENWKKIHSKGNSFDWSGTEEVKKVSFDFEMVFSENTSVVW